jgi:outer membrane protein assembly factor BamB
MFRCAVIPTLLLAASAPANAQCSSSWTWRTLVGGSNLSPAGANPSYPWAFVAAPSTRLVEALDARTGARPAGYRAPTLGGGVESYPMLVQLSGGVWRVFVAALDGHVYAIDAGTGAVIWSADLRRPLCASDSLTAPPAVVLRSVCAYHSGCAMPPGAAGTDLVVIGTRMGCGPHGVEAAANRVVALRADNGVPVWMFNATLTDHVDYVAEGASLDYERNRIYVGTGRRVPTDNSVFALNLTTGAKAWARNVGRTETTPLLSYDAALGPRLYVATLSGTVRALDPVAGADVWSPPTVSVGSAISVNLAQRGQSATLGNRIFAVSPVAGTVSSIRDNGGSATLLWTLTSAANFGGALAKSAPAVYESSAASLYALYAGMSDGTLRQIRSADATTSGGVAVQSRVVDPGGGIVGDAVAGMSQTFDDPRLVVGDNAGYVSRWCIPW